MRQDFFDELVKSVRQGGEILSGKIQPARRIHGSLRLPGDKSISHRAAILAALSRGRARLANFSTSEDCAATLACLRQLGVTIERDETTVSWSSGDRLPCEAFRSCRIRTAGTGRLNR